MVIMMKVVFAIVVAIHRIATGMILLDICVVLRSHAFDVGIQKAVVDRHGSVLYVVAVG
jgi:hypothetical protein